MRGDSDTDGVIAIPAEHEAAALAAAEQRHAAAAQICDAVRGGMRLDVARQQFLCHQLHSKPT